MTEKDIDYIKPRLCRGCPHTGDEILTSLPPKIKCQIDGKLHSLDDRCTIKPRLCEILGVEVGERFRHVSWDADLWIDDDGDPDMVSPERIAIDAAWIVIDLINHPERLIRKPRLTEPELAICRAVGAKWVSMDDEDEGVQLWGSCPVQDEDGRFNNDADYIAGVVNELFPSVHPGDCIEAEIDAADLRGET